MRPQPHHRHHSDCVCVESRARRDHWFNTEVEVIAMMRGRLSSTALIRWKLVRSSSCPCAALPSSFDLSRLTIHPVYKKYPDYDRTTSQRCFSSLATKAWAMLRTGSFHPPNPLLPTSDLDTPMLPDFTHVQPYHLVEAARQVNEDYIRDFHALEQSLQNDETQVSAEWLLGELKRLQEPVAYIQYVAALYHSLFQIPTWENASNNVATILYSKPHEHSHVIMKALESFDQEGSLSIHHYLNMYRNAGVQHEQEDSLQSMHDKLQEVEARLKQHASAYEKSSTTREQLEDMYAMVVTKTQVAKLLGSNNYAEYILASERRMATSPNDVSLLHEKVNKHYSSEFAGNVDYEDTREYLTLDGVLMGMFGLTRALFGIEIQESESPCGWTNDVRLFHAVEETTKAHLASVYLDPYFRGTKARYCFLSPLGRKSMFLNAPIAPPAWNNMPTPLKFEDALALFHEFGHALQFILAKESPVPVDHMPQDVSEMMPLFLEHFLLEEPILQSLAHLSDSAKAFPTELVHKLREQRCAEKEQTMNQRAFLGQMELEVFLDGGESLVLLQRRLAEQYVPHRLPDKSALGPLLEIMVDNANGKHMCRYRYLWSEVMAADIYSVFQEAGVENQDRMRELGLRLRRIMIEPGGLLDGQAAFREFRGRDMAPDAMFAMFNSKNSSSRKD